MLCFDFVNRWDQKMGCDIHFSVERRSDASSPWEFMERDRPDQWGNRDFYDSRNYNLFAILADVRNGSGFAGCDTGDGFVPIVHPRGVPDDASKQYLDRVEQWDGDGHSHSHITLRELLDYDWTQTSKLRGMVDLTGWADWKGSGEPKSWCGFAAGGGIVQLDEKVFSDGWKKMCDADKADRFSEKHPDWALAGHRVSPDVIAEMKQHMGLEPHINPYCVVEWVKPYYEAIGNYFFGSTIPQLLRLGEPENVRCVFFFDN